MSMFVGEVYGGLQTAKLKNLANSFHDCYRETFVYIVTWLLLRSSRMITWLISSRPSWPYQMPRITKQDSLHFQLRVAMSNKLKRAWAAYQKYKLITRIIAAFAGAIAGISGCVAYVKVYQNYNAATWAAISAVFAILFLRINFLFDAITKDSLQGKHLRYTCVLVYSLWWLDWLQLSLTLSSGWSITKKVRQTDKRAIEYIYSHDAIDIAGPCSTRDAHW